MIRTCANCRFWCETRVSGLGECRRRAPVSTNGMFSNPLDRWPATLTTDWCGDGQPKFETAEGPGNDPIIQG